MTASIDYRVQMEVSEVQYENRYGKYRGSAKMDSFINLVHVVGLQRTASNCFKVHAARAARLFSLARPIKFLIYGVVVAVPVINAKAPYLRFDDGNVNNTATNQ